ncbi:hypothetical protein BC833DRAFT_657802 [Globomyces pollinis-pini]|nr:hypothetical protein BC833DRAFT_657802 [Globomyces pollinis-pini]
MPPDCDKDLNEFVSLSVQGSLFVLNRKTVVSMDWMVSTMLSSTIPSKIHLGSVYIDCDPTSFRLILSILRGITDMKSELPRLSSIDLCLLKSTANCLLCDKIVKQIENCESELEGSLNENKDLEAQLVAIKQGPEFQLMEQLKSLTISKVSCNCYMSHRKYNKCGNFFVIVGDGKVDKDSQLLCDVCSNDIDTKRVKYSKFNVESISNIRGFSCNRMVLR